MRLFIGIELSAAARCEMVNAMAALSVMAPGRYVRGDMLHITLAFPGEISEAALTSVRSAMNEAAQKTSPFELKLASPGYFGRPDNALLYCGVAASDALGDAAETLRARLENRGISFDPKPFRAHITLARHARTSPEALALPVKPVAFAVNRLTLFHSHRVDGVLTYTPIYRAEFSHERGAE
jgi:2'-5' RNA ligase